MQMLMWSAPGVKAGHNYLVTFTVSGMTHGVVEASLGRTMTGSVSAPYVPAAGFTAINDNFTTANGLTSAATHPPGGDSTDPVGAFRIFCAAGTPAANDPVVYPGLPGRSHLHTPWGNTQSLNPAGSYAFWRAHGGTTCGERSSKTSPLDRAAYWMPSMLDGAGNVVALRQAVSIAPFRATPIISLVPEDRVSTHRKGCAIFQATTSPLVTAAPLKVNSASGSAGAAAPMPLETTLT
jgi:hypothetical protein